MARHGENIRKRADGRWEGRYRVFDENRGNIYRSVYGGTYEQVKEKLLRARLELTNEVENRAPAETGCTRRDAGPCTAILFSQVAQEWLADIADKRKYSTYIKYETIYRTHLAKAVGSCKFSDVAASEIQANILEHLSEASLSQNLQKNICCVANQIMIFAGRKYSINITLLEKSGIRQKSKPVKTFSKTEQAKLLSSIYRKTDTFKIATLLCLYTGLRLGELCALKWTDFDFKNMSLTVNRTVQRIAVQNGKDKTFLLETDPKSEDSKRIIPLTAEIAELLVRLRGIRPYVFGGEKPLEPRTMQYRFKKQLTEAGIDDRNFHILRHTFATNCIENGMDVKALSEILGHSDVKITLNRYVHPTMDSKRKQLGRLPDFYGQILGHVS
ncbi:MAG: site-specific integrase [Lachnospiraceae bacterium]|nr:site-specific integrase [Lachnospiraceae bacterium]